MLTQIKVMWCKIPNVVHQDLKDDRLISMMTTLSPNVVQM